MLKNIGSKLGERGENIRENNKESSKVTNKEIIKEDPPPPKKKMETNPDAEKHWIEAGRERRKHPGKQQRTFKGHK